MLDALLLVGAREHVSRAAAVASRVRHLREEVGVPVVLSLKRNGNYIIRVQSLRFGYDAEAEKY